MKSYLELSVQRDIDRIKTKIVEMARLAEKALKDCLVILSDNNRQLAYAVILRDQNINAKEKEIDRLCLEFLVRQQPVALPLRFAYSTIKVNLEIERIGDYAESIARKLLRFTGDVDEKLRKGVIEIGRLSLEMFHDAALSFVNQDQSLAKKCMDTEQTVDALRTDLNDQIKDLFIGNKYPYETLDTMLNVVRRFERVSDQAGNICMEVLYMCTGESAKHPGSEFFRVLFVDSKNTCSSQIAEAVAMELKQQNFIFSSAGVSPAPVNHATIEFMKSKDIDLSKNAPKAIHQIPNLDFYQVIIALDEAGRNAFPYLSPKIVFLDWSIEDPMTFPENSDEQKKAFENVYKSIKDQLTDLVNAVTGVENPDK